MNKRRGEIVKRVDGIDINYCPDPEAIAAVDAVVAERRARRLAFEASQPSSTFPPETKSSSAQTPNLDKAYVLFRFRLPFGIWITLSRLKFLPIQISERWHLVHAVKVYWSTRVWKRKPNKEHQSPPHQSGDLLEQWEAFPKFAALGQETLPSEAKRLGVESAYGVTVEDGNTPSEKAIKEKAQ